MFTIVGLGNPGDEYKNTRHNIGWIILGEILSKHNLPSLIKSSQYTALISEGVLSGKEVGIIFPTAFMNNSGVSIQRYVSDRSSLEKLIVVHDDIDLPFGEIKISYGRGAGGHNGVRSIIDECGATSFIRIRVGIAQRGFFGGIKRPTGEKLSKYVLGIFTKKEINSLPDIVEHVDIAIKHIFEKGVSYAMQEGNK
ncbi:MAG: aminoacyl-tRNA hydrolase [Candidatus Pacebacteria bacterium]|nr:aminoacyl-tRNA hydrolase [Candidatus Paceibacterota bacterium]MCF7857609.1 aminoacyl-tRNA hydrolase [Candidatus Paceibacterota bacterium]